MGAYALSAATLAGAWRALKADAFSRPALGEPSALGAALTPAIVALVVPALGMFLANWKIGDAYGEREIGPLVDRAVADWLGTAPVNVDPAFPLVRGASPERAKLTLIEFADFRCGHCKHAAPTLDAFVASRPDVRFLFQPWPLDGACNPKIPQAYGASCALARASYCASKSGSATGWAAHKWLYEQQEKFTSNEAVDKAIGAMAGEIGLQEAALVACVASDEARDAVAKQSAVGDALDIPGTPTIYANGRKLPYGQVLAVLRAAYDHAAEVPPPNRP
jgi:protein-disulfide isomerase